MTDEEREQRVKPFKNKALEVAAQHGNMEVYQSTLPSHLFCAIIILWNNRVTARALASHVIHRMGGGANVFQFSRPYGFWAVNHSIAYLYL